MLSFQCISKPVWKGMLKILQLLVGGLEHSYANRGLGGMASGFQVHDMCNNFSFVSWLFVSSVIF